MISSENVHISRVRTLLGAEGKRVWEEVPVLERFYRPWHPERSLPKTEFRGVHDGDRFAFRFDVEDDDIVLGDGETEGERVMASDRVEIFFSTDEVLSLYYGLEIDPRGNVLGYLSRFYREFDRSWDVPGDFRVDAKITDGGYQVEGSIDLQALRALDVLKPDGTAIAGIFRAEFSHTADGSVDQDWMPWIDPKTEMPDFHVPEAFGRMIFEDF